MSLENKITKIEQSSETEELGKSIQDLLQIADGPMQKEVIQELDQKLDGLADAKKISMKKAIKTNLTSWELAGEEFFDFDEAQKNTRHQKMLRLLSIFKALEEGSEKVITKDDQRKYTFEDAQKDLDTVRTMTFEESSESANEEEATAEEGVPLSWETVTDQQKGNEGWWTFNEVTPAGEWWDESATDAPQTETNGAGGGDKTWWVDPSTGTGETWGLSKTREFTIAHLSVDTVVWSVVHEDQRSVSYDKDKQTVTVTIMGTELLFKKENGERQQQDNKENKTDDFVSKVDQWDDILDVTVDSDGVHIWVDKDLAELPSAELAGYIDEVKKLDEAKMWELQTEKTAVEQILEEQKSIVSTIEQGADDRAEGEREAATEALDATTVTKEWAIQSLEDDMRVSRLSDLFSKISLDDIFTRSDKEREKSDCQKGINALKAYVSEAPDLAEAEKRVESGIKAITINRKVMNGRDGERRSYGEQLEPWEKKRLEAAMKKRKKEVFDVKKKELTWEPYTWWIEDISVPEVWDENSESEKALKDINSKVSWLMANITAKEAGIMYLFPQYLEAKSNSNTATAAKKATLGSEYKAKEEQLLEAMEEVYGDGKLQSQLSQYFEQQNNSIKAVLWGNETLIDTQSATLQVKVEDVQGAAEDNKRTLMQEGESHTKKLGKKEWEIQAKQSEMDSALQKIMLEDNKEKRKKLVKEYQNHYSDKSLLDNQKNEIQDDIDASISQKIAADQSILFANKQKHTAEATMYRQHAQRIDGHKNLLEGQRSSLEKQLQVISEITDDPDTTLGSELMGKFISRKEELQKQKDQIQTTIQDLDKKHQIRTEKAQQAETEAVHCTSQIKYLDAYKNKEVALAKETRYKEEYLAIEKELWPKLTSLASYTTKLSDLKKQREWETDSMKKATLNDQIRVLEDKITILEQDRDMQDQLWSEKNAAHTKWSSLATWYDDDLVNITNGMQAAGIDIPQISEIQEEQKEEETWEEKGEDPAPRTT